MSLRVCLISDTHTYHDQITIPECDLLISAGDYSYLGRPDEVIDFHRWLDRQPAKEIISVQGNHELGVEKAFGASKLRAKDACPRAHFIDEGPIEIFGKKIWCSSITPEFHGWAYNRGDVPIKKHWDLIPDDTEILVTHGPPHLILDATKAGYAIGCPRLRVRVSKLKNLKLHVFGHNHYCGGQKVDWCGVTYINASVVNEDYEVVHAPIELEIE